MTAYSTLVECLHDAAINRPEHPFLTSAGKSQSFAAFARRCDRIAGGLKDIGVERGDVAAVMLPNCAEWLEIFFAAARLGAPIAPIHPAYRHDEVDRILADCQAVVLISDPAHRSMAEGLFEDRVSLRRVFITDGGPDDSRRDPADDLLDSYSSLAQTDESNRESREPVAPEIRADDTLSLTYTSGSTGAPRGVLLSHANYLATARDVCDALGLGADDRIWCGLPFCHVGAQILGPVAALLAGATLVMPSNPGPGEVEGELNATRATILEAMPGALESVTQSAATQPRPTGPPCESLRFALTMGASIHPAARRNFEAHFRVPLLTSYGLTEACGVSAIHAAEPDDAHRDAPPDAGPNTVCDTVRARDAIIGKPLKTQEFRILVSGDESDGDESDAGENSSATLGRIGELLIRGPNLMQGYASDEAASALAIRDGWLHTGDLGFVDERGFLRLAGRKKELIVRGDEHIYPEEVEEVLRRHPAVTDVGVLGICDDRRGLEIVAFVVLAPDHLVSGADLREYCKDHLAPYKCPDIVELRDLLPTTPTGRVRKSLLAGTYRAESREPSPNSPPTARPSPAGPPDPPV
jgi:long-chain acyl-CoA synthetase